MHCVWCWKIKNGVFVCVRAQGDNFGRFASQFHSHSPEVMDITEGHCRWKEFWAKGPPCSSWGPAIQTKSEAISPSPFGSVSSCDWHTNCFQEKTKNHQNKITTTNPTNKNGRKILLLYTYWTRLFRLRAIWALLKIQGDMLYINIYFSAQSLFPTPHHLKDVQLYTCRRSIYFR